MKNVLYAREKQKENLNSFKSLSFHYINAFKCIQIKHLQIKHNF
jgi:hypothetical protein